MNFIQKALAYDFWFSSKYVPRHLLTKIMYFLSRINQPRRLIQYWLKFWIRSYKINLDDYETPLEGFASFNEFHLRSLKPSARVTENSDIVFPCDAIITDIGTIRDDCILNIKGNDYTIQELIIGSSSKVSIEKNGINNFLGGTFLSLYLPLEGYHWWHSPTQGVLRQCIVHDGDLVTVNVKAQKKVKKLFAKNHRLVEFIEIEKQPSVILVAVATTLVGTILSVYKRVSTGVSFLDIPVDKGQKLGGFSFGSAMVVLLSADYKIVDGLYPGGAYKLGNHLANHMGRDVKNVKKS